MSESEAQNFLAARCHPSSPSLAGDVSLDEVPSPSGTAQLSRVRRERARGQLRPIEGSRLAVAALIVVGGLWGAGVFFAKVAFTELPVSHVALYRYAIAALVMLPIAILRRVWPRRRDIPRFLLTGFLIVPGTFLLQYRGMALTSASSAALIIGALPLLLAISARWFLGERAGRLGWLAIGISTLGVTLVVGIPRHGDNWLGDVMVLLSLLSVVGWVFISKPLVRRYAALPSTAYLMSFGTMLLLPISLSLDGVPRMKMSASVLLSVLTLGLGCSAVTNALWNWGVTRVPTSRAGVYTNSEPLVGVLLGVWALHESLSASVVLGGALIIVSAVLISLCGASPSMVQQSPKMSGPDLKSL